MWWLALLGVAHAASTIELSTTPGARAVVLPGTEPRTVEIGVYGNRAPLMPQLDDREGAHLLGAEVVAVGGGTAYLSLHLDRDDLGVRVEETTHGFALHIGPLRAATPPVEEQPLRGPRRAAVPPQLPLTPLRGDASTALLRPRDLPVPAGVWPPPDGVDPALEVPAESWSAVEGYRHTLADPQHRAFAVYQLGSAHLELGWPREALYYFHMLLEAEPRPWPDGAVELQAARAALALGRWDEARELCWTALDGDGADQAPLACLGAVALASGDPAPTPVGRALAEDDSPMRRLMAAQLLLVDHRYDEALPILEGVLEALDGDALDRARLSLGDAHYQLGDSEAAHEAWRTVEGFELRRLGKLRRMLAGVVLTPRNSWTSVVVELDQLSREDGPMGAEAAYMLAQIHEGYGDPGSAAVALNTAWDAYPAHVLRSDVPERLLAACESRVEQLHGVQRWADLVAWAGVCWRHELDALSAGPRVLERTASALEELGLPHRALEMQRRATQVWAQANRDDPAALLRLAELFVRVGRPVESLDTLDYLAGVSDSAPLRSRMELLRGDAHDALGDDDAARAAWLRARRDPEQREPASTRLAVASARAGDCASASRLAPAGPTEARLVLARCWLDAGRPERALSAAAEVAVGGGEALAGDALWVAGAAAARDVALEVPEGVVLAEPWAAVVEEARAVAALDAAVRERSE